MISFTVSETAALLHAEYINGDAEFNRVSSDTRTLEGPALFVAIHGERFDGHDYVGRCREGRGRGAGRARARYRSAANHLQERDPVFRRACHGLA